MRKLKMIIMAVSIWSLLIFIPSADITQPISSVYKEGVHRINASGNYNVRIQLLSEPPTSIVVTDETDTIIFLVKLPKGEYVDVKYFNKFFAITVIGKGEVTFTFEKIK